MYIGKYNSKCDVLDVCVQCSVDKCSVFVLWFVSVSITYLNVLDLEFCFAERDSCVDNIYIFNAL